jgi:fluoride exporter
VPGWVVVLVGTGFCGTLTTFSAFGADVVRMGEARALGRMLVYVVATLVLGLGAAAGGYWLAGSV